MSATVSPRRVALEVVMSVESKLGQADGQGDLGWIDLDRQESDEALAIQDKLDAATYGAARRDEADAGFVDIELLEYEHERQAAYEAAHERDDDD